MSNSINRNAKNTIFWVWNVANYALSSGKFLNLWRICWNKSFDIYHVWVDEMDENGWDDLIWKDIIRAKCSMGIKATEAPGILSKDPQKALKLVLIIMHHFSFWHLSRCEICWKLDKQLVGDELYGLAPPAWPWWVWGGHHYNTFKIQNVKIWNYIRAKSLQYVLWDFQTNVWTYFAKGVKVSQSLLYLISLWNTCVFLSFHSHIHLKAKHLNIGTYEYDIRKRNLTQ